MVIVFQIDYPDAGQHSSRRTMNYDPIAALRPELYLKSNRSSHSSDTSSAYSGSDTMHSVQSSLDAEEVDLSGLVESVVDSDEDEDLAESIDVSFWARRVHVVLPVCFSPAFKLPAHGGCCDFFSYIYKHTFHLGRAEEVHRVLFKESVNLTFGYK